MNDPALLTALGGVVVAAISFLGGRRLTGGSVSTSTADRLWKEAGAIREALRFEVEGLRHELSERDDQIASFRLELMQKEEEIQTLRHDRDRLTDRVAELESALAAVRLAQDLGQ